MNTDLERINKVVGGELSSEEAATFEQARVVFQEVFDPDSKKAKETIDEIAKLLTVSTKNLEEVRNQNWFQRSVRTVTGSNRKLAKMNGENLLKVQKGAFFFLEGLAHQNQALMTTVYSALKRVESQQIRHERLKALVIRSLDGLTDRIEDVEWHQNDLDRRTRALERELGTQSNKLAVFSFILACAFAGGSLGAWFYGFELWWISAIAALPLIIFGIANIRRNRDVDSMFQHHLTDVSDNESETILRYISQRDELWDGLQKALRYKYLCYVFDQVNEIHAPWRKTVGDAFQCLGEECSNATSRRKVTRVLQKLVDTNADQSGKLRLCAAGCAESIVSDWNGLLRDVTRNQRSSDTLLLRAELEHSEQSLLSEELFRAVNVGANTTSSIVQLRKEVSQDFPRLRKIMEEDDLWAGTKEVVKGFFIFPALFCDRNEFVTGATEKLDRLLDNWANYDDLIWESLAHRIETALANHLSKAQSRWLQTCDALYENGVSLATIEHVCDEYFFNRSQIPVPEEIEDSPT